MVRQGRQKVPGWLLFFYRVPSKPVSSRMRVWRKLTKAGAVQLKGSVYLLPFSEDHHEFLQWLVSEIAAMKGDSGFARVDRIETMQDRELIALFDAQRVEAYRPVKKAAADLESRLTGIRKGSRAGNISGMGEQISRLSREFEEISRVDFFSTVEGESLKQQLSQVRARIKELSANQGGGLKPAAIITKEIGDYQGRIWVTRERPYVDRMASAWLIRRFIDSKASFRFTKRDGPQVIEKGRVTFDLQAAEFTHAGDLCTFEAMVKAFRLKDRTLNKICEIVHELDMKDGRYTVPEAKGVEEILSGLRKSVKDDTELLEKGMAVFEMLYAAKSA
ncbi:MAG: hypothetical protein EPN25_10555 [Nitrospirae bacterium]|nr:MAG: hypothetical protein EPN25_10555 [Nitrospirota bacterium]